MHSVPDFVSSGCMSKIQLRLQHETKATARDKDDDGGASKTDYHATSSIPMENAVRISLLLTRSFVFRCQQLTSSSNAETIANNGVDEKSHRRGKDDIKLKDFFINIEGRIDSKNNHSSLSTTLKKTKTDTLKSAELDTPTTNTAGLDLDANIAAYASKLFGPSNVGSDERCSDAAGDKHHMKSCEEGEDDFDMIFDTELFGEISEEMVDGEPDKQSMANDGIAKYASMLWGASDGGVNRPIHGNADSSDRNNIVNPIEEGILQGTILGVWSNCKEGPDVFETLSCLSSSNTSSNNTLSSLQILGKLLYGVFSGGREVPSKLLQLGRAKRRRGPSMLENLCKSVLSINVDHEEEVGVDKTLYDNEHDFDDEEWDQYDMAPKTSKLKTDTSVLSNLLESELFPASVCRLLSDLLAENPVDSIDDHSTIPFASFDEVIENLEQMVEDPATFLHDVLVSNNMSAQKGPMFGERYFGRRHEVSILVKIANEMERELSLKQSDAHREPVEQKRTLDAVFVSGIAGSGKSYLVQTVISQLSEDFIVIKSKFKRGMEHASRGIVSNMFDQVILYLVKMKESSKQSDVSLGNSASTAIMNAIGTEGLKSLTDFLPSIPTLYGKSFDTTEIKCSKRIVEDWQLVASLVKILEAVLRLGRLLFISCDDMQWSSKSTISLLGELITRISGISHLKRRCYFVGMLREDEVDDYHPFSIQYSYLQTNSDINTTEVKLDSLAKSDVVDMLMETFRLPKRLVVELATEVCKRTSGHAIYIIQLLNKLVRESTIYFSPHCQRYVWDQDAVDLIHTSADVAGLIISNYKSLPISTQQILQIISMFGTQTDMHLLSLLENYQSGLLSSLKMLIEKGILDRAGPIVIFSHDLIQQSIYESQPLATRQRRHREIGVLLGTIYSKGEASTFHAGNSMTSSLISLVCDQLILAGEACTLNESQRKNFSEWNLIAAQESTSRTNFCAAKRYFLSGIFFLDKEACWTDNKELSIKLHEGAAASSYALGEAVDAIKYAEMVTRYSSLEESIFAHSIILKSLTSMSKHDDCIAKGIDIVKRLDPENFNLPLSPTKEGMIDTMINTKLGLGLGSGYSVEKILNMPMIAEGDAVHGVVMILEASFASSLQAMSPLQPLTACAIVDYTIKRGVCGGSAMAFALFGRFLIYFQEDYASAKKCSQVAKLLTEKYSLGLTGVCIAYNYIDIYFESPQVLSERLYNISQRVLEAGEANTAMIILGNSSRCLLYGGGMNLSQLEKLMHERSKKIARHSKNAAKFDCLDNILLGELLGSSARYSIKKLQAEAKAANNNSLLFRIHLFKSIISYWRGDFAAADQSSDDVLRVPMMMPTIHLIYFTFFRGLIKFQCYSENKDNNRLQEGKEMMDRMGVWAKNCNGTAMFGNKWLLLRAEYAASLGSENTNDDAELLYLESIKAARDHGYVHELGLAYELLGDYYTVHEPEKDSIEVCMKQAYKCYNQWGATKIANKVLVENDLDLEDLAVVKDSEPNIGRKRVEFA